MFSSKYYDVSISSYAWLVKKIAEYDLWTVHSPYGGSKKEEFEDC